MKASDSVRTIKGIGEKSEKLFAKLGIQTVGELLSFYPREYEIFTSIAPIASAREGNTMIIEGTLATKPRMAAVRNLKVISCKIKDASGQLHLSWFNMPFLMKTLKLGVHYIIRGKVVQKNGMLQMVQPKMLTKEEYSNQLGKMQPIYSLTAGLTNHAVAKATKMALEDMEWEKEFLPVDMRKKYDLLSYKRAIKQIHYPKNKEEYAQARRRLVFEEFFLFSLALQQMKETKHSIPSEYTMTREAKTCELLQALPYELTDGQKRAWQDIKEDLQRGMVMNRLIQGDVGSGKTVVAMMALLYVAENGHQGAIMVPTEVLAKQHYEEFLKYMEPLGIRVGLVVGSMTAATKRKVWEQVKNHIIDIVVGTHTLIQEKAEYDDLALIVTDEQHRFGVKQREEFSLKGKRPHMLVMSATPIPRTLAIIMYGDLDVSLIQGLPANRLPIKNCAVGTNYRPQAYRFMEKQVAQGHQVYVICPVVEESENMEAENVMDYTATLREMVAPSIRIEYLHGKMKPKEKNRIMEAFAKQEIDILVSTTVIEVGINVPNATVMMIENAERFGLAQLHQLRGRVGRGSTQSYCIFMAGNPSKETMERLAILEKSNDGFCVAKEDLQLRGPGDLFGIRQSGELYFKIADIFQDTRELKEASEAAGAYTQKEIASLCRKYEGLGKKMREYTGEILL